MRPKVGTSGPEQDLMHRSIQEDSESTRVSILQQVGRSVPVSHFVEDGAPHLSPADVIVRETIVRMHPNFYQPVPDR